jgi:hypothetical protein
MHNRFIPKVKVLSGCLITHHTEEDHGEKGNIWDVNDKAER